MGRELVITSDDLGMTLSVNRGIESAYLRRALTSTNFMVPCPWFEHAAMRFASASIDLGVHLTLTCEWEHFKWRPLSFGGSLRDANGYFYRTIRELMENARADEIRAECHQQIASALRRGLPIGYVDLHMCIPSGENPDYELVLMRIVDGIAAEFDLNYSYALDGNRLRHFRSALSISGKDRATVEQYLRSLDAGVHHLSCHCALDSDEQDSLTARADSAYPWSLPFRRTDLACITSTWFRELLQAQDIALVGMPFDRAQSGAQAR